MRCLYVSVLILFLQSLNLVYDTKLTIEIVEQGKALIARVSLVICFSVKTWGN